MSSLTQFDLSAPDRARLEKLSAQGDAEASIRIAEFYIYAGEDGDPNVMDDEDKRKKRHWLEVAANQGHRGALSALAVDLASDNCLRARWIMTHIADTALEEEERLHAQGWLKEAAFSCG